MRVTNWLSTVVLSTLIMLAIALHETQGEFLVKGLTKKKRRNPAVFLIYKKQHKPLPLLVGFEAQDPGEVFLP